MAIKHTGSSLSLTEIQAEFGGSNPISLTEYYAGGSYVPAGTVGYPNGSTGAAVAIPSSGQISVKNFYGSTKIPSSLSLRVLIVGGGGAGGQRGSGDNTNGNGGGGAGAIYDVTTTQTRGSYSFTIGQGGLVQSYYKVRQNNDGGDTTAFGFTAKGGGAGGFSDSGAGRPGGCGGGGAAAGGAGGNSTQTAYGSGYAGATAGGGAGGGGGGAGSAGFTGTRFGEGGLGYTWIDDRVYAGGGASSSKATYAAGGGGRGGNGLGTNNTALATISSRIMYNSDGENDWWQLDVSWAENWVYLPAGGYWRYRIDSGSWVTTTVPYISLNMGRYDGINGPPYKVFRFEVQAMYSTGSTPASAQVSTHDISTVTVLNRGYGTAGIGIVRILDSTYWGWNSTGSTNSYNTGNWYGTHAWFYGGAGGAGSTQGGGGTAVGGSGRNGVVIVSYEWPYQVATGGTTYKIGNRHFHRFTASNEIFSW